MELSAYQGTQNLGYDLDSEKAETNGNGNAPYSPRVAVSVEGAKKRFGKEIVLNGLYMTVEEGTIYGLLGSSGSGKTTLLSSIVGLRKLDEGRISIFGKSPGSPDSGVPGRLVGYMPQETALNGEFTMDEVCQYFGRLYGIPIKTVQQRRESLVEIFGLERCRGQISTFSGGQKRRASFVIALLHQPDLLILDEPTVGVDPLLRAKIWSHIRHLTDTFGTTVIVTTHYIEEMRQTERVGIMRGGQLMAEASPTKLMSYHNATMLEDVVLKYCTVLDTKSDHKRPTVQVTRPRTNTISFEHDYGKTRQPSNDNVPEKMLYKQWLNRLSLPPPTGMDQKDQKTHMGNRIWALLRKNLTVLLRNTGFLLFLFIVPGLVIGFFAMTVGKTPFGLGLGIVSDQESLTQCARAGARPFTCNPNNLTCAYLEALESFNFFNLHEYSTIPDALADVEKQKIWGYVHLGKNFSQQIFHRTVGNETVDGYPIQVRLDVSGITTGQLMKKYIAEAFTVFSNKLLTACEVDLTTKEIPVEIGDPIYGEQDTELTSFIVPGYAVGFLPFMAIISCALSYIAEKKDGMLDRSKVAGVTAFEIMLSHALPQLGIIFIQILIIFVIMFFADIPLFNGSPILAFVLLIVSAFTGMSIGFTAAELFDQEKNAMLFAMATIFPSFMLSGIMWPLESVPHYIRIVAYFLPATFPCESIRSILFRGWGLSHFSVYFGFLSQFIYIGVFIALTYIVHKIRK